MPLSEEIERLGERETFRFVLVEGFGSGKLATFLPCVPEGDDPDATERFSCPRPAVRPDESTDAGACDSNPKARKRVVGVNLRAFLRDGQLGDRKVHMPRSHDATWGDTGDHSREMIENSGNFVARVARWCTYTSV